MPEPLVHLVCGSTGAGKTTYAMALAKSLPGLRFSIDEWMNTLFWPDLPSKDDAAWAMERIDRCLMQMRAVIAPAGRLGIPSVVDAGFSSRAERKAFADWAAENDLAPRLHYIEADAETRWTRVTQRNAARGAGFAFDVTREMFDFVETLWEPPDAEELAALDGVRVDSAKGGD